MGIFILKAIIWEFRNQESRELYLQYWDSKIDNTVELRVILGLHPANWLGANLESVLELFLLPEKISISVRRKLISLAPVNA